MVHGDSLQGFIAYSCVGDESTVLAVAVAAALQGRGLGAALLQHALAEMREGGVRRCLLEVRVSNTPARRLYTQCGFVEDGVRKNYYRIEQGREDAVLMSLNLMSVDQKVVADERA